MTTPRPDGLTLLAFAALVGIAGCNFVAVKISNEGLAPFWGATLRFLSAAAILGWIAVAKRLTLPRGRALAGNLAYGILGFGLSYAFAYWSLLGIRSNLLAVFVATVPLLTVILAALHGLEPFRLRSLAAAGLSFGGILLMVWKGLGSDISVPHLFAGLMMPLVIAESTILVKKVPGNHPLTMNAIGMAVGGLLLLAASLVAGEARVLPSSPRVGGALLYLILIGSALMFTLFLFVLQRWTASATSYQAVLSPIVTAFVASLLVDEPITVWLVLGGIFVLGGVYFGAVAPRARAPLPPPVAAPGGPSVR